ncbi:MAG: hypothetical protein J6Y24_07200 [Bacteroidales bacterium]|nr:hypothetical protein [Bacteroidales bacterium]
MKQYILISILLLTPLLMRAQSDSSRHGGYIPLFDNLTSPDVPLPNDYNGKLRTTNSDSTQVSVEEAVENLRNLYNAGRFSEALGYALYVRMRKHEDRFTKEETEVFHKYAIASMKEMGFDYKADSLMKIFCRQSPFYEVKDDDPDAFVKLKDKFVTRPILGIRVSSSKDYPIITLDTVYTVRDKETGYKYQNFKGSSFGADVVYYPMKNLEVSAGVMFSKLGFTRLEHSQKVKFSYTENDRLISFPVEVGYCFKPFWGLVIPEFFAGARLSLLHKSTYEVSDQVFKLNSVGSTTEDVACEGNFDNVKNSFVTLYGGFRLNYEIRRVCFFAGAYYAAALGELRKPEDNYTNVELIVNHRFMPDAIRVGQVSVNLGVKVNLYYKTFAKYGYGY